MKLVDSLIAAADLARFNSMFSSHFYTLRPLNVTSFLLFCEIVRSWCALTVIVFVGDSDFKRVIEDRNSKGTISF